MDNSEFVKSNTCQWQNRYQPQKQITMPTISINRKVYPINLPIANQASALSWPRLKTFVVETGENDQVTLKLTATDAVDGFIVLLKKSLPSIY